MSQNDMTIDNSTGANVRADINSAIQALATNNSGSSAPSTTFATQFFADTNAGIMKLRNTSNNGYVNLFTLAGGIDVDAASNFNEDVTFTGASANIVFDKSDNQLEFADNAKAEFGTGGDLEIFHNGTDSILINNTGQLSLRANNLHLTAKNTENYLIGTANGAVELYFDNSKKLETKSAGLDVTGQIDVIGGFVSVDDNFSFVCGSGGDAQLFHNGSNLFLLNTTGSIFLDPKNSERGVIIKPDDAVELYYDNSKKFETQSSGTQIFGNLTVGTDAGAIFLSNPDGFSPKLQENAGALEFSTNNNLRATLDSSGRFLIGTTTESASTDNGLVFFANGAQILKATGSSDHDFLDFYRGTDGSMARVGHIRATGSSTAYNTSSDYRLKENVTAISDGITRLKTLKPYRFNFKIDKSTVVDGFLAHEVTAVPEAITGTKDEVDSDNNPVYQGIDQSKLVPLLVAAVQELIGKVEALEAA